MTLVGDTPQPVLVLSPHPDDETFGCGGTIKLLSSAGVAVDVLFMTRGEMGFEAPETATTSSKARLAEVRTREAEMACSCLGVRHVYFADGADGSLATQPFLVDTLRSRLGAGGYDRVFCPWPGDNHIDHKATFELLQRALRDSAAPMQLWLYEVWSPLNPTLCIPIDTTIAAKREAMQVYKSQLAYLDYSAAFEGLSAYRGLFCSGARYAEAFRIVNHPMG